MSERSSSGEKDIQALWFANSGWGYSKGQDCIRAQVALRPIGIDAIPMTNVENACAGGSTAFHHAWLGIAGGLYDITMAVGAEKLYDNNKMKVFAGFLSGLDIENLSSIIANISFYGMSEQDKKDMQAHVAKYAALAKKNAAIKRKKRASAVVSAICWICSKSTCA